MKRIACFVAAAACIGAVGAVELTHRWSFNAATANVKRLTLDPVRITIPQGYRAFLKRSGDNLALRIDKLGATLILR